MEGDDARLLSGGSTATENATNGRGSANAPAASAFMTTKPKPKLNNMKNIKQTSLPLLDTTLPAALPNVTGVGEKSVSEPLLMISPAVALVDLGSPTVDNIIRREDSKEDVLKAAENMLDDTKFPDIPSSTPRTEAARDAAKDKDTPTRRNPIHDLTPSPTKYSVKPVREVQETERRTGRRRSSFGEKKVGHGGVGERGEAVNTNDGLPMVPAGKKKTRRKSWGELFGLRRRSYSDEEQVIVVPQRVIKPPTSITTPSPMLGEIRKLEMEAVNANANANAKGKEKRGFRKSFGESVKNILGVKEFDAVLTTTEEGEYPDKIVKRLRAEAKRYENIPREQFPPCVMNIFPSKTKNTHNVFVYWNAQILGPDGTIWARQTIDLELFVGPQYPFKGPTISYEGNTAEFVVGKNQTDPREGNVLCSWTPAMNLLEACVKIEDLLKEQHKRMLSEGESSGATPYVTRREMKNSGDGSDGMRTTTGVRRSFATSPDKSKNEFGVTGATPASKERRLVHHTEKSDGSAGATVSNNNSNNNNNDNTAVVNVSDDKMNDINESDVNDDSISNDVNRIIIQPPISSPDTPIVKLSEAKALPRRGSWRGQMLRAEIDAAKNDIEDVETSSPTHGLNLKKMGEMASPTKGLK